MNNERNICPAEHAGMLDNPLRRLLLHPGKKILSPHIKEGNLLLDLGCGPGTFTDTLAVLTGGNGRVIAVDLQEKMLELMEEKMQRKDLASRVKAHLCRPESLMLEEYKETADFALAFWMAHETPDVRHFLQEVYDTLRPSGSLLCAEPKPFVSQELFREMIEVAKSIGYEAEIIKGIRFSRAALFIK